MTVGRNEHGERALPAFHGLIQGIAVANVGQGAAAMERR